MKRFQIFRYINQAKYIIIILSLTAGLLFYRSMSSQQSYSAQTAIRYSDASRATPKDILSAAVLNRAIEQGELAISMETLRARLSVKEIIPEEESEKMETAISMGKEYEYLPTDFKIIFNANADYSESFARDALNAVLDAYIDWFAENRVQAPSLPGNLVDLSMVDYDYLEKVEKLESFLNSMSSFLGNMANANWYYRSSQTGYGFRDLRARYDFINEHILPYLYVDVLDNALTKDSDVLLKKYKNRVDSLDVEAQVVEKKAGDIWRVIESYTEKNKEGTLFYNGSNMDKDGDSNNIGGNILNYVYDNENKDGRADRTTTYDVLISDYATYLIQVQEYRRQQEVASEYLDAFGYAQGNTVQGNPIAAQVNHMLIMLQIALDELYDILVNTMDEYLSYQASQQLTVLSSIYTQSGLNMQVYLVLAIGILGVMGCGGAVVLGRAADFIEYFVYVESKLGIYNRKACDSRIDKLEGRVLGSDYTVFFIKLCNIREINIMEGKGSGDEALRQLASFLSDIFGNVGFVGYNNNETFLCLVEDYPYEKALNDAKIVRKLAENFVSESEHKTPWRIAIGIANSSQENLYAIRKLISRAYVCANQDERAQIENAENAETAQAAEPNPAAEATQATKPTQAAEPTQATQATPAAQADAQSQQN